jgi:cellulose synthase/poly-beta-1,6-N-acetylglucosamine synthase-like glycosyltransferase
MVVTPILLILILYGLFLVYILLRLSFYKPFQPASQPPRDLPSLSVVIPFKNEAHNLDALCASLAEQDYSGEWEVVFINDGSQDDFAPALSRFRSMPGKHGLCIDSHFDPSKALTSKQQALDRGIDAARHEWVVLTDADMTFSKDWLSLCASNTYEGFDLAFGHTAVRDGMSGPLAWFERFQLEFLFAAAYAFHAAGIAGSCMGNNLLIRKKAYLETGGQAGIGFSIVEDRDLYKGFKRRGRKIAPCEPFSARAFTAPCPTLSQFYHQMLRWARGGFSNGPLLFFAALLFTFQNILFSASLFGAAPFSMACVSAVNFVLSLFFTLLAFKKIHSRENALFFPFYMVLAIIEAAIFCISFIVTPRLKWKERKI